MTEAEIDASLARIESVLESGGRPDLAAQGFWRAVAAMKRNPVIAERFADRAARVDRMAFERWALLSVPIWLGSVIMVGGSLAGAGLVSAGYYIDQPWNGLAMLGGLGILLVTTHGLVHLLVGLAGGIGFSHWFIGDLRRPQPGVKIDYSTYLRTTARNRAWMHASAAIFTKVLPFIVLGSAIVADVPAWSTATIVGVGVVQVITDVTISRTRGDWKKFSREMSYVDR